MNLPNKRASDLLGKDKQKAQIAAENILNTPDIEAWKCLIENSDYIFGYIKERAAQNLIKAANANNIENIFCLLKYYSSDWDWCIAQCLNNNVNEKLNAQVLELLSSGTQEEKAYAAKFFSLSNDIGARNQLFIASREDFQPLKNNAAEALGKLNDDESYNYFIEKLNSDDDWEKVEAAEFLSNYGDKKAIIPILKAMSNSGMAEYIAGEAASLINIHELFENDEEEVQLLALEALDNIISGLAETWNLSALLSFQIYESLDELIELAKVNPESDLSGKYAQLLLKAKSKITLFVENSQYTYDEEKTVLSELEEIHHLLICENEDFWNQQIENLNKELKVESTKRKLAAIAIINELNIGSAVPYLKELILNQNESEIVICESILTLAKLGALSQIDNLNDILSGIKDENLLAIVQNAVACLK